MDEIIVLLETGEYLHLQFSSEPAEAESFPNDYCIDYTLYNSDKSEGDGGLMEYNSNECGTDIISFVPALLDFINKWNGSKISFTETDLDRFEDGFED